MGAGCRLGLALYTMSSVLTFATWMLVGLVPCQDLAPAATGPPSRRRSRRSGRLPCPRSRSRSCKERGSGGTVKLWWTPTLEIYEVVEIMIVGILK